MPPMPQETVQKQRKNERGCCVFPVYPFSQAGQPEKETINNNQTVYNSVRTSIYRPIACARRNDWACFPFKPLDPFFLYMISLKEQAL
jgi:hypothetical protein